MEVTTGDAECHDRRCVYSKFRESYHASCIEVDEEEEKMRGRKTRAAMEQSMWSDGVHSGDGCED